MSQIEESAKLKSLTKDPLIVNLVKKTAEFRVASSSMIKVILRNHFSRCN